MTRFHFNFFRCRDAKGHLKEIYTHFTCATDTTNIQVQLGWDYTHTHIIPSDPCHVIFCHWPPDLDTAPHCACSWLMSCKYWGDSTAVVEQIFLLCHFLWCQFTTTVSQIKCILGVKYGTFWQLVHCTLDLWGYVFWVQFLLQQFIKIYLKWFFCAYNFLFQFVFDAVTDVIIKNNLKDCGLF